MSRPWLPPGRPPPGWPMFDDQPRPRWWHGIGQRVALVALLFALDFRPSAPPSTDAVRQYRKDVTVTVTVDPFDYRCRRCHTPMEDDLEFCGAAGCRSYLEALRAWAATWCRGALALAKRLGLVE